MVVRNMGSNPGISFGELLLRIKATVNEPFFDPLRDMRLDVRRGDWREGKIDVDGSASADCLPTADNAAVIHRRGQIVFIHKRRIAAGIHRTPYDKRSLFHENDPLARPL